MSLKDIDTFIQHFVQKSVQVIVQSRLGTEKRTQTKSKPNGKDWFNLDITDLKDIFDQTTKCLRLISGQSGNQSPCFVKKNWKICCEISLRNSDGITLDLEYWIFSNVVLTSTQEVQDSKLSQLVYSILNRMSSMLKAILVLTRSTPAFKLSSKGQSADSYVICYRVFQCDDSLFTSIMDSVNQTNNFSQVKPLGSIKSFCNELSISLIYRTNMNRNSEESNDQATETDFEDTNCDKRHLLLPVKDDHFKSIVDDIKFDVAELFKPLNPAFAAKHKDILDGFSSTPFSALLPKDESNSSDSKENENVQRKEGKSTPIPISIPSSKSISKSPQIYSTSNDSFVFVELNAPFASDDREFGSFFHGPSPTFINNNDDSSDINELSVQLAELESNAPQFDSFVESICITESQELKFEA